MCYVHELLKDRFTVSAYYYNPNIMPVDEYNRRLSELVRFSNSRSFLLLLDEPERKEWIRKISPFRYRGERSVRCHECYRVRLEHTFMKAEREHYDIVATSLTISPHKDADAINSIGSELSSKYGIPFYEADFKKKDGFKKSVEMSRLMGFYRQDYCGCIYSMLEKDPASRWSQKVNKFRAEGNVPEKDDAEELELGTELDLHHFNPADTEKLVNEFLKISSGKKYRSVRIVHGKGKSRVKLRVHTILKSHPAVVSFRDDSYNWGATVVELNTGE